MPGKMARSDPRPSVRVTRGAGSGQHLASVLQEGRENANIDVGLGFIWRISDDIVPTAISSLQSAYQSLRPVSGRGAEYSCEARLHKVTWRDYENASLAKASPIGKDCDLHPFF